jgi:phosphoesterase RecJ-like protein
MASSARERFPSPAIPQDALEALRPAQRIALIGHVTPDADCLGAMGAIALALRARACDVHAALPAGTVSNRMRFLTQLAELAGADGAALRSCDLAVVVDTAKDRRVNVEGKLDALPGVPVLNIDHHATNTHFGRWNWVDASRSSTCEMVFELLEALGTPLSPAMATLLYAGIHADTQGFSLPNTSPRCLAVAAELAACGARIAEVGERLERSNSPGEFELLRVIYRNTRLAAGGQIAWSCASHAEIAATGCDASDIDSQVEVPRSIAGIRIAILLTEGNPGKVRINFRGEPGTPVLPLAQEFGGGGHLASAGAMIDGNLPDVSARVVAAAERYLAALPAQ